MLRSLAGLFPKLLKRDVVHKEPSGGSFAALASLQRRIRAADKVKPPVRKPATDLRADKAAPDRGVNPSGKVRPQPPDMVTGA